MYESFYGMCRVPFARSVPVEKLYTSDALEEASSRLLYTARNKGFAVLTGECGTGKSTLLRRVSNVLAQEHLPVVYISDGSLTPGTFYREVLSQLGLQLKRSCADAKRHLFQSIENISGLRETSPVCICDESHLLNSAMFEEIRFILNRDFDSSTAMGLILCGQPELARKLKLPACTAIRQRIDIRCTLYPFERSQTSDYIECHLKYAGGHTSVFTASAIAAIHEASGGVARMIDKICTSLLMYGAQKAKHVIDDSDTKLVIDNEFV